MKRTQLILTHAAVFAVGIASALVGHDQRARNAGSSGGAAAPTRSSPRHSAGGDADGGSGKSRDGGRADTGRAAESPAARLDKIVRMTDPLARQRALMDLVDTLGADQFAMLAEQFRTADHYGDSNGDYSLILRGWAKLDPQAALDFVMADGQGHGRSAILETWAANDPAAAERWATEHFTGEGANPYMAAVIRGIAGTELATATRLTEAMPRSNERAQAIAALTEALFLQGADAAKNFPATIADEAMRGGLVSLIGSRLADKNPQDAAQWLAAMQSGADQHRAAREVGEALARQDPSMAAGWLQSLQPEARSEAARGIIPRMASGDASNIAPTATWVASLAGTPGYDNVVEEFVWSCNTRMPEQSAAWIQGVTNPDQQRRLYHRMLGEWAQKDAAAVRNWVAANNVPDDVRRRFLR